MSAFKFLFSVAEIRDLLQKEIWKLNFPWKYWWKVGNLESIFFISIVKSQFSSFILRSDRLKRGTRIDLPPPKCGQGGTYGKSYVSYARLPTWHQSKTIDKDDRKIYWANERKVREHILEGALLKWTLLSLTNLWGDHRTRKRNAIHIINPLKLYSTNNKHQWQIKFWK